MLDSQTRFAQRDHKADKKNSIHPVSFGAKRHDGRCPYINRILTRRIEQDKTDRSRRAEAVEEREGGNEILPNFTFPSVHVEIMTLQHSYAWPEFHFQPESLPRVT